MDGGLHDFLAGCMAAWMDSCMDGKMAAWMDGCLDGWLHGLMAA